MYRLLAIIFLSAITISRGDESVRFPPPLNADPQGVARVEKMLDSIVIPHFSVTNMPLNDALSLLTEKTVDLNKPRGYVLNSGTRNSLGAELITIDRHDVTYPELLDELCRKMDLMWQISPITIIAPREHFERLRNEALAQ